MSKNMKGFAIVTGGSRGLGAAMVRQLAREGYDVVINYVSDRSGAIASALAEEVKKEYGVGAITYQGDISSYQNCKNMVEKGVEAFGEKVAVLINNAGIASARRFDESTPEQYENLVNIELLGSMHCTHVVLPYMEKEKGGNIIFITSVAGLSGGGKPDYSACKAGMHGFMRSLVREVSEYGIRVNCIAPGAIKTEIFNSYTEEQQAVFVSGIPLKHFGKPQDIADAMSYIINANYVTGQIISPNGGSAMY